MKNLAQVTYAAAAVLVVAATLAANQVAAEDYPTREVRIIVGYNAGSTTDQVARTIADKLSDRWNQPVIVDNRPGASGISGAEALVHSDADGYTFVFDGPPPFITNELLRSSLPYDPDMIIPVVPAARVYVHYAAAANVPADTMAEFAKLVTDNPGTYSYGATVGSSQNLVVEGWKRKDGLDLTFVPYTGSGQGVTDLLGGRLSLYGLGANTVEAHVKEGTLKLLGVSTPDRLPAFPDVSTLEEQGLENLNLISFFGFGALAGTPPDIIDTFAQAVSEIVNDPEFKSTTLTPYGFFAAGGTPQEFAEFLVQEHARYSELVELSGIKLD